MTELNEFGLGKLTPPELAAREVLALLHDAPERLAVAYAAGDAEGFLSIVSCIHAAIGEARRIYDDRIDRFLEGWNGPERIEVIRSLSKLAEVTKVSTPDDEDAEVSEGDAREAVPS